MRSINRRSFFRRSLVTTGATVAATSAWAQPQGANDSIGIAIVGLRKRGKEHIESFLRIPGVRIVALCDCDTQFLDAETVKLQKQNKQVKVYVDYRKLLEDKDVDAVVIVTPDHWHAVMTVWACQAGKDVYIEKPLSHSIWEGKQMVEAARRHNRIVQTGSQNRSDVGLREAVNAIQSGQFGDIQEVLCGHFARRSSIGRVDGPQPIPATCDYNLFQGPARLAPLMREQLHYDWHWFWETGTGEMGNIGAHQLDQARWVIGQTSAPSRVLSFGGRYGWDDDGETPNTHVVYLDYKPVPILYEIRSLPRHQKGKSIHPIYGLAGLIVRCEGGAFVGGRGGGWLVDPSGKQVKHFPGDRGMSHQANFIDAVRSRNAKDLRADVTEGHVSATLCHMANISYRLGKHMHPAAAREALQENQSTASAVDRVLQHLEVNDVDTQNDRIAVGPTLEFDPKKERFVGDRSDEANMFLKRNYRKPFTLPELG